MINVTQILNTYDSYIILLLLFLSHNLGGQPQSENRGQYVYSYANEKK